MGRIQVLAEQVANQIAAGEVVERPASVVKELVENSLDAGARRIVVEVEGGGRELIRVTDDGCGMDPEDARLCLLRHATSKIRTAEDLQRITTLGFRGEALPSIAAVSRMEIRTRPHGAVRGTRVLVEGGQVLAVEEVGAPPGTRVEVRDLFYNTPARLKFLKTPATELARIGEAVGRLALAHPGVAVRFRSGMSEVFATPGNGDLLAAAAAVLGTEVARQLAPVDLAAPGCRVTGYVGLPAAARAGRGLQHFVVNGRPVQAQALRYALEEAYTGLIPVGRYPVAVLLLELDPELVDANVHPAKLEVRFRHEREVRGAVYRATRAALGAAAVVPAALTAAPPAPPSGDRLAEAPAPYGAAPPPLRSAADGAPALPAGRPAPTAWPAGGSTPAGAWEAAPRQAALPAFPSGGGLAGARGGGAGGWGTGVPPAREAAGPDPEVAAALAGALAAAAGAAAPVAGTSAAAASTAEPSAAGSSAAGGWAAVLGHLRPLGQVHRTYIACDGPEGLYLIDQHAAHERIFFERILAQLESQAVPVQPLLFPPTLELSPAQWAVFREVEPILAESGIHAEAFGGRTIAVKAVPMGVGEAQAARLVGDFLDRLVEGQMPRDPLDRRRRVVAALAACKAAIKARDPLQPEEMAALIRDLAACQDPGRCPHGRPTVIVIHTRELEKRFGRA